MPNLSSLNCSFNEISTLFISADSQNANTLQSLSLDGNDISTLEEISNLNRLSYLSVSSNRINKFDIAKNSRIYSTLLYLEINGNELKTLDGIVDLENLWDLDITRNPSIDLNQLSDARFLDTLQGINYDKDNPISEELLDRLPGECDNFSPAFLPLTLKGI